VAFVKHHKNHPKKISKNKKTMTPVSDVFLPLDRRWFKMMPYHVEAFQPVSIYIYICTYNLCSMLVPENDSTSTMFERYHQSLAFTNRIAYGFAARGESTGGRCLGAM
jgi:hypothetical protein